MVEYLLRDRVVLGSNPSTQGRVTQRTLKMVLIATLCDATHIKSWSGVARRVAPDYASYSSGPILERDRNAIENRIGSFNKFVDLVSTTVKLFYYN